MRNLEYGCKLFALQLFIKFRISLYFSATTSNENQQIMNKKENEKLGIWMEAVLQFNSSYTLEFRLDGTKIDG